MCACVCRQHFRIFSVPLAAAAVDSVGVCCLFEVFVYFMFMYMRIE